MKYHIILLFLVHATCTYGELTEFLWSQEVVSGVYKNDDGSLGIRFISSQTFLQIDTLDNITVVYLSASYEVDKRQARSVNIMDSQYLQHKNSEHSHLDGPIDDNTKDFNDALEDLLQLEESTLLENASRALGDKGVTGRNTPAILPFYMFALQVTKTINAPLYGPITVTNEVSLHRQKKGFFKWVKDRVKATFKLIFKNPYKCSRYAYRPKCEGLCGLGCWCWRWVCGDCCWHKGCAGHDKCCNKRGFFSFRCLIPWGFSCDGHYHC